VRTLRPDEIHFPLGVGGHIDHRTVFAAHPALATHATHGTHGTIDGSLAFYEDRPYAFPEIFTRLRLHELGVAPAGDDPTASLAAAFAAWPHLRAYVPSAQERAVAIEAHARLPAFRPGLALVSETATFGDGQLARAAALVAGYRSQCRALFGVEDPAGIAAVYRAAGAGAFDERSYRIAGAPAVHESAVRAP
jgi:hypothetical protein